MDRRNWEWLSSRFAAHGGDRQYFFVKMLQNESVWMGSRFLALKSCQRCVFWNRQLFGTQGCSSEKELADIFPFSPPASCHSGAMVSAVTTQRGGFGFKPARWGLSEWSLHVLDVPAWVLAFSHRHAKTCTFLQVGSTLECVQMCLFNVHFAQ